MTEVASAPAVAVPLIPTHATSSVEEEIHNTEVVDALKAELEKAVKGVDVSGADVDPAQRLDEHQKRVLSGDTIPEEKAEKAEHPVSDHKETDVDTVDADDAAVPLVDVASPPSVGPTEESIPEVQATPVESTAELNAKNGETGLEVSSDTAVSVVEPTSESKDTEPTFESKAELEPERIPVEAVAPHQQPETHVGTAKTEDIVPEDTAATKTEVDPEVDAKEDAKEEVPIQAAEEPIEERFKVNEPTKEPAAGESVLADTSDPEHPANAPALEPAEINAEQDNIEPVSAVPNVESEDTAPSESQQAVATTADDAAKKAYELAHARANDEVILCTPTDEEIRAAADLESGVVPETETEEKETQAETEVPVPIAEPETDAPEEHDASSIQEQVEKQEEAKELEASAISEAKVEEVSEAAPEVLPAEPENTEIAKTDGPAEEEATVEPEPIVAENADASTPKVFEDKPEEKEITSSSEVKDEAEVPFSSAEDAAVASEDTEDKDVSKDAPKQIDAADSEDKIEEVSRSSTDAPVEPVADAVSVASPAEDLVVPKEEVSAAVEYTGVDSEPAEPASVSHEVPVSEPAAAEAEEQKPVDGAMKDFPKEIEDEQKPTEVLVSPSPAPVEAEPSAAEEELVTEAAQEIPSTSVSSEEAALTDAAEPPPIHEEDKPEIVDAETSAPDIPPVEEPIATGVQAEDSGVMIETEEVFEPAATPAIGETVTTEKAASSDVLAANIDEVDELLQEESVVEAAEDVEKADPEVRAAPAEALADIHEPSAVVSEKAEVEESTLAAPGEELIEDVAHVTVPEPAGTASAELAGNAEDEVKPVVEEDEKTAEREEVREPQAEAKPELGTSTEARVSDAFKDSEEEPEEVEVVPNVSVETPTPMSETLSFMSSEDDEEDDVPLESRLAKAVGISPQEVAKLPALSSSTPTEIGAEDETTTPTKIMDETKPDEGNVEEDTTAGGSQEHETPTQSVLFEPPEDDEVAATQAVIADTNASEAPERPKSPWTPSYSVTTQGASPVHPEEPEEPKEELSEEKTVDVAPEVVAEEAVPENLVVAEVPPFEEVSRPSKVEDTQVLAAVPTAPTAHSQIIESDATGTPASETITDELPKPEETTVLAKSDAKQAAPTITEAEPSDETLIDEKPEAPLEATPAALTVDTGAKEVPDRPKSPWTPSYSVTKVGLGIPEPEELHLDADVPVEPKLDASSEEQQAVAEEQASSAHIDVTEVPLIEAPASESVPVVERPKSPYPPSYSVTQMGPGVVGEAVTAGELEEGGSIADTNEPEMPSTPRSELRSVTPGFDTLSEVSESSHIPNPPDSPRTDPEVASLMEAEAKTPLVTGIEEVNKPISPLATPLLSAKVVEDLEESSRPLTEAAVSGIGDSEPRSLLLENDAEQVASRPVLTEYATEEAVIATETADNHPSQANEAEDSVPSAPEFSIPKIDVTAVHPAPPVIVTNTLSTDSAYTQFSDTFSPSQETGTNVTTPDVETMPVPKVYEGSEIESLGEETAMHVSEQPSTVTPTGTVGKGKSLGVAHTLAMRSFPSAFAQTEDPSASEQSSQVAGADTLEVDDQLSPLASRRRLESTASALAFPGGWVYSPVKKERASLETATGVFSKPVVEGKSISPVVTPSSTEPSSTEPASEQSESKWRCVIM
ncbi:hypothetical protein ACEPAG_7391 [Sanghuangporus baumii]